MFEFRNAKKLLFVLKLKTRFCIYAALFVRVTATRCDDDGTWHCFRFNAPPPKRDIVDLLNNIIIIIAIIPSRCYGGINEYDCLTRMEAKEKI